MSKDLMITELEKNFLTVSEDKPEYKVMATNIKEKMPAIQQASSNFYKSHSQFMNVMLDVTAITPIRSIKQRTNIPGRGLNKWSAYARTHTHIICAYARTRVCA